MFPFSAQFSCLPSLPPLANEVGGQSDGKVKEKSRDSLLDVVKMFESCPVDYPAQEICFDSLKTSQGREVKSEMNVQICGCDLCIQSLGSPAPPSLGLCYLPSKTARVGRELRAFINTPPNPPHLFTNAKPEAHTRRVLPRVTSPEWTSRLSSRAPGSELSAPSTRAGDIVLAHL